MVRRVGDAFLLGVVVQSGYLSYPHLPVISNHSDHSTSSSLDCCSLFCANSRDRHVQERFYNSESPSGTNNHAMDCYLRDFMRFRIGYFVFRLADLYERWPRVIIVLANMKDNKATVR